jgi:hypothetical protein
MSLKLDESVKNKQREWSSLLQIDDLAVSELPAVPLKAEERLCLSTLWLHDAAKGGNIDFPQTTFQLICYDITRSHVSLIIFTIVCFVHMSFPYLEKPYCAWTSSPEDGFDYIKSGYNYYLGPQYATLLEFVFLIVYYIEIFMRLVVNRGARSNRSLDFYTKVRLVLTFALTIDVFSAAITFRPQRMLRALIPFIYITRRKSLRQMTVGLLTAMTNCFPVFLLLFFVIMAWSFLGRLIFGYIELDVTGRFGSLFKSFMTTLESYSCRGYVIFALDPLFKINAGSSVFFITLTVFADVFCTALIIATGNRQYQLYSMYIFRKELLNRKRAMLAVFGVLAQHTFEIENQLNETSQFPFGADIGDVSRPIPEAGTSVESSSMPPSAASSNAADSRPSSARSALPRIYTRNIVSDRQSSIDAVTLQNNRMSLYRPGVKVGRERVSLEVWLQFCSFLTGSHRISPALAEMLYNTEVDPQGERGSMSSEGDRISIDGRSTDGLTVAALFRLCSLLDGTLAVEGDEIDVERNGNGASTDKPQRQRSFSARRKSGGETLFAGKFRSRSRSQSRVHSNGYMTEGLESTRVPFSSEFTPRTPQSPPWRLGNCQFCLADAIGGVLRESVILSRIIFEASFPINIPIPFTNQRYMTMATYFNIFVFLIRCVLVLQLIYYTQPGAAIMWDYLGWALQVVFWIEGYIRAMSAYICATWGST